MTCSLALRTLRLRDPRYPSALARTLRRLFLLWTDRLTLAIGVAPDQARPSRRSTRFLSPPVTSAGRARRRVRLVGFFSRRWARFALRLVILPVPVTLKRLAAPRCVFIFGMSRSSTLRCFFDVLFWLVARRLLGVLASGVQHHGHVPAVLARGALDRREFGDVVGDPAEDLHPELGVGHLTTAEHDRELHLVALAQEPHDVLHLGGVVVLVDLRPELHVLDDDVRGLALRLSPSLFLLVDVPAVVHDPADGRVGVGRDLHQIELLLAGLRLRFREGADPQLLAFGTDEKDLAGSDAVVDPDLVCSYLVTYSTRGFLPGGRNCSGDELGRTRRWRTRECPPSSDHRDGGHATCGPGAPVCSWGVSFGGRVGT